MQDRPPDDSGTVSCTRRGSRVTGTYEIHGRILALTSPFGTVKVPVGLTDPEVLASRILRSLCTRADRPSAHQALAGSDEKTP